MSTHAKIIALLSVIIAVTSIAMSWSELGNAETSPDPGARASLAVTVAQYFVGIPFMLFIVRFPWSSNRSHLPYRVPELRSLRLEWRQIPSILFAMGIMSVAAVPSTLILAYIVPSTGWSDIVLAIIPPILIFGSIRLSEKVFPKHYRNDAES